MRRLRLRLFPKFLAASVLLSVIPVVLVGQIVLRINTLSLQFEVQRYHHLLASSLANSLDVRLQTLESQLNIAIATMRDSSLTLVDKQRILSSLLDSSPHISILSLVGPKGNELMKVYNPTLAPELEKNPQLIEHSDSPLQSRRWIAFSQIFSSDSFIAKISQPTTSPNGSNSKVAFLMKFLSLMVKIINFDLT